MEDLKNLKLKVDRYQSFLENTTNYRKVWKESLAQEIQEILNKYSVAVELELNIEHHVAIKNLEAVTASLGKSKSGIADRTDCRRAELLVPAGVVPTDVLEHL